MFRRISFTVAIAAVVAFTRTAAAQIAVVSRTPAANAAEVPSATTAVAIVRPVTSLSALLRTGNTSLK